MAQNIVDRPAWDNFFHAVAEGVNTTVAATVAAYPDAVHWVTRNDTTALMVAIDRDRYQTFLLLLSLGANLNGRARCPAHPERIATILHYAAVRGKPEYVRALLERGAETLRRGDWETDDTIFTQTGAENLALKTGRREALSLIRMAPALRQTYVEMQDGTFIPFGERNGGEKNQVILGLQKELSEMRAMFNALAMRVQELETPATARHDKPLRRKGDHVASP